MNNPNAILIVEDILKNMNESAIKISQLKKKLPKQINHSTLMVILEYLEGNNKIFVGLKGITWIHSKSNHLKNMLKNSLEV